MRRSVRPFGHTTGTRGFKWKTVLLEQTAFNPSTAVQQWLRGQNRSELDKSVASRLNISDGMIASPSTNNVITKMRINAESYINLL